MISVGSRFDADVDRRQDPFVFGKKKERDRATIAGRSERVLNSPEDEWDFDLGHLSFI